jgi:zinc protease
MMAEGTTTMSADQLASAEANLGNGVSARGFFTITRNVDASLDLMADQLLHPLFPQASLDRIKTNTLAGLQRQKDNPQYVGGRILSNALYGSGHPYARHETEASITAITRDDLIAFHHDYYRPRNTTLIVTGDITPDAAVARLERAFGRWEGGGKTGEVHVPDPKPLGPTAIDLYDRPGSPQSMVLVGQLGPRRDTKDYFALDLLNTTLGGAFNSRLNLDLREVHGWTYGAQSGLSWRRVPELSTWEMGSAIATPKTDSALVNLVGDIKALRGSRPVTDSELSFAKRTATLSLPLQFATISQVAEAADGLFENHLPLDYYDHLVENYDRVTLADVNGAAQRYLDPAHEVIVIVGDKKAIDPGIEAAHLAPVQAVTTF